MVEGQRTKETKKDHASKYYSMSHQYFKYYTISFELFNLNYVHLKCIFVHSKYSLLLVWYPRLHDPSNLKIIKLVTLKENSLNEQILC